MRFQSHGSLDELRKPSIALFAGAAAPLARAQSDLCFNQLQVLGSHNSYHQAPPAVLLEKFGGLTASPLLAWQYSHSPLAVQLDAGVRAFELDAYWDPQGGLYGQAAGLKIAGQNGWLTDPRYKLPGFKVLHVPDFDFRTSCVLLSECLADIKAWSGANPTHLPIRVYIEVKPAGQLQSALGPLLVNLLQGMLNSSAADGPTSFVQQPENTAQAFVDLNAELAAAFGAGSSQLLTPDGVRAALGADEAADLGELLRQAPPGSGPCPWPPLDSLRGKVMVVLLLRAGSTEGDAFQQAFPNLKGSLAWVEQAGRRPLPGAVFRASATGRLTSDDLTFALPDNASAIVAGLAAGVRDAVAAGYLVRARADADTVEARASFFERRDALFGAGGHVVSSDFIVPAAQQRSEGLDQLLYPGSRYRVALPGGRQGRCLRDVAGGGGNGTVPVSLQAIAADGGSDGGDGVFCGPLEEAMRALDAGDAAAAAAANSTGSSSADGSSSGSSESSGGSAVTPEPTVAKMSGAGRPAPLAALAAAGLLVAAAAGAL